MDLTEKYIKMCSKVPKEMIDSWEPKIGDFMLLDYRDTTGFDRDLEKDIWGDDDSTWLRICNYTRKSLKDYIQISDETGTHTHTLSQVLKMHHVPIWRQDQLQDMIPALPTTMNCTNLSVFIAQTGDYGTWEQLWLAFVMKTKYNKVWDDEKEEWVDNE